jgi:hypothetical protein
MSKRALGPHCHDDIAYTIVKRAGLLAPEAVTRIDLGAVSRRCSGEKLAAAETGIRHEI